MQRILEPELMEEAAQVKAYAEAGFSEPHGHFIELLKAAIDDPAFSGFALDLGCGPGDVTVRFARAFPGCTVHAVDGSLARICKCNCKQSTAGWKNCDTAYRKKTAI